MRWTEAQMFYAQLGSNGVAIVMLLLSLRKATAARLSFAALFLWASQVNWQLVRSHPGEYLDYAELAYLEAYRTFILGFFSRHLLGIVSTIAVAQFLIGVLVLLEGAKARLGLIGAIVFLLSIAPLGVGSGFPSSLILAAGAAILCRMPTLPNLFKAGWRRLSPVPK